MQLIISLKDIPIPGYFDNLLEAAFPHNHFNMDNMEEVLEAILKKLATTPAGEGIHQPKGTTTTGNKMSPARPQYDIGICPDTGRQFLVEIGKNGNICELNRATIQKIKRVLRPIRTSTVVLMHQARKAPR